VLYLRCMSHKLLMNVAEIVYKKWMTAAAPLIMLGCSTTALPYALQLHPMEAPCQPLARVAIPKSTALILLNSMPAGRVSGESPLLDTGLLALTTSTGLGNEKRRPCRLLTLGTVLLTSPFSIAIPSALSQPVGVERSQQRAEEWHLPAGATVPKLNLAYGAKQCCFLTEPQRGSKRGGAHIITTADFPQPSICASSNSLPAVILRPPRSGSSVGRDHTPLTDTFPAL